jgi:carbon storage regulator
MSPYGALDKAVGGRTGTGRSRDVLYLTRKIGESVIINDDIEVTVIDIRGKSIKLGFTFPTTATVLRREIFERIQEENRAAAAGSEALAEAMKNRPQRKSGP